MALDVKQYGAGSKQESAEAKEAPSAETVTDFHTNADTDVRNESIHHTLGANPGQAAPGDHVHDGVTSQLLLDAYTIQTSAAIATWRGQVENALQRLGAKIIP